MKNSLEEKIKHDLPIGVSFESVKSYLEKSNIEYSWDEKNKAFYGIIRNVKKYGLVSENITLVIDMDNEKKIKSIKVSSILTGT
jgi:hypothetical protein